EMQFRVKSRNRHVMLTPWEAEEFRDAAFRHGWNLHMAQRRAAYASASVQEIPPTIALPSTPTQRPRATRCANDNEQTYHAPVAVSPLPRASARGPRSRRLSS